MTAPDSDDDVESLWQSERGPKRRCIVTREQGSCERMVRFVISPDAVVVPDLSATLPGRGIWLSATRDVLETARGRNLFSRAARGRVTVPADLESQIEAGLRERIVQTISLARRAGQAVGGFVKCREWIASRKAGLVVQARGGSEEERARLMSGAKDLPIALVEATALAQAFGREHAVWAVLGEGRLAARLAAESERFWGLTGGSAPVPRQGSRTGLEQAGI